MPIPSHSLEVQPRTGQARLRLRDFALEDAFTIPNALFGDPGNRVPAVVSFDLEWDGGGRRVKVSDYDTDFAGDFVTGPARIQWSARNDQGFRFHSDPAASSRTEFAYVGRERNGEFFP